MQPKKVPAGREKTGREAAGGSEDLRTSRLDVDRATADADVDLLSARLASLSTHTRASNYERLRGGQACPRAAAAETVGSRASAGVAQPPEGVAGAGSAGVGRNQESPEPDTAPIRTPTAPIKQSRPSDEKISQDALDMLRRRLDF